MSSTTCNPQHVTGDPQCVPTTCIPQHLSTIHVSVSTIHYSVSTICLPQQVFHNMWLVTHNVYPHYVFHNINPQYMFQYPQYMCQYPQYVVHNRYSTTCYWWPTMCTHNIGVYTCCGDMTVYCGWHVVDNIVCVVDYMLSTTSNLSSTT